MPRAEANPRWPPFNPHSKRNAARRARCRRAPVDAPCRIWLKFRRHSSMAEMTHTGGSQPRNNPLQLPRGIAPTEDPAVGPQNPRDASVFDRHPPCFSSQQAAPVMSSTSRRDRTSGRGGLQRHPGVEHTSRWRAACARSLSLLQDWTLLLWPGQPYPLGALPGMGKGSISPSSPSTPKRWNSAIRCVGPQADRSHACQSRPTRSGMATCRKPSRASFTATGCMGPTIPKQAIDSTRRNCSLTRMPNTSGGRCAGPMSISGIGSDIVLKDDLSIDRRNSARQMPKCQVDRPGLHLGQRPPTGHALA
jgi:hypothetical protein